MRYLSQTVNILVECDPAGNRTRYKDVHELLGHIANKIFALQHGISMKERLCRLLLVDGRRANNVSGLFE